MSSLVISIISIVLVLIIAVTGVFYGSDAFTNNKIKAEAARYINEQAQVTTAITAYEANGNMLTTEFQLDDLVEAKLLKSIPVGWSEYSDMIGTPIYGLAAQKELVCLEVNKKAGFVFSVDGEIPVKESESNPGIGNPYCSDSLDKGIPCCVKASQTE